jgi:hypothetical protein
MAVARTIGVSLNRLTVEQRARYLQCSGWTLQSQVRCWLGIGRPRAAGRRFQARRFCHRLADLILVSDYRSDPEWVVMHDVIDASGPTSQSPDREDKQHDQTAPLKCGKPLWDVR